MRDEYIYYVYIMQSASRRALYIGMTNNLRKRVWQHKNHKFEGFTDDYNCTRLVYWESFDDVANAIDREKQLKRWRREKKDVADRTKKSSVEGFGSRLVSDGNARSLDCGDRSLRERSSSLGMTMLYALSRVQGRYCTLSRAKQDDERSESFCAVEGPCVQRQDREPLEP